MTETPFHKLIQLSTQYKESAIFNHALSTGLFDLLERIHSVEEVAANKLWDVRKTRIFLNALVAIGLLETESSQYRIRDDFRDFLLSQEKKSLVGVALMEKQQWGNWTLIEQVLSINSDLECFQESKFPTAPENVSAFYQAMRTFARMNSAWIASLPLFREVKEIVDICGGHGHYLCDILRAHPQTVGSVWDLEHSRKDAELTFNSRGLVARASFRCCDVMDSYAFFDLKADCALLFDCLHYFPKERLEEMFAQIHQALNTGGYLLILTQSLNDNGYSPKSAALFSFDMLMNTRFGELHTLQWIKNQVINSGFAVTLEKAESGMFELIIAQKK